MDLPHKLAVFLPLLLGPLFAACDEPADGANNNAAALGNQQSESKADQSSHRTSTQGQKSRPKEDWPDRLVELVEQLRGQNAEPEYVDVRYADPDADNPHADGGFYWRMPADKAAVDAHVKMFGLEKTRAGTHRTSKMYERFPKSWPKPKAENVTWYAGPHNRDDTGIKAHFWEIMIHDERERKLYVFYWIWDIGI
jgi:hypothetical protein